MKQNMKLEIMEMTPEDVAEVAALEAQIFSMPWTSQGFLDILRLPDSLYLTVRLNGRLIGYCGLLQSFDEADITNVAVTEQARGQGVGREMLLKLMRLGKERGISRYTLEVRAGNVAAIHLYQKLGFESAGVRKNFYERPTEDAVIMWTP
jgi:ribosomal-protein-alanine N-acetyltransferase